MCADLPRRPARLAAAAVDAHARPARAAGVRRLAASGSTTATCSASTPLVYPPLIYLLARMVWVGFSRRPRRPCRSGRTHMLLLIALMFALMGFRLGLNNQDSNILDVGYAGVVGRRPADGRRAALRPHARQDRRGRAPGSTRTATRSATSSRPTAAASRRSGSGDTYGPTVYLAYVPAVAIFGWSGLWDDLPAAHVAASAFDLLAIAGPVRRRLAACARPGSGCCSRSAGRPTRSRSTRST